MNDTNLYRRKKLPTGMSSSYVITSATYDHSETHPSWSLLGYNPEFQIFGAATKTTVDASRTRPYAFGRSMDMVRNKSIRRNCGCVRIGPNIDKSPIRASWTHWIVLDDITYGLSVDGWKGRDTDLVRNGPEIDRGPTSTSRTHSRRRRW